MNIHRPLAAALSSLLIASSMLFAGCATLGPDRTCRGTLVASLRPVAGAECPRSIPPVITPASPRFADLDEDRLTRITLGPVVSGPRR